MKYLSRLRENLSRVATFVPHYNNSSLAKESMVIN